MASMTADQVNVVFGADVKGLTSGLQTAQKEIEGATSSMTNGFKSMGASIEGLLSPFALLSAAALGVGAALEHAISKTTELTREAFNFGAIIGITTMQASALKQALEEIGLSTDTYTQAFLKFTRQVKNNGSDLEKEFGLKLRDVNGHLRDGTELFNAALAKVFEYKAGIDQDTVAMALFGKSVADVILLQRLSSEAIAEATVRNTELALGITENNVVAYQAWQKASNDAKDGVEAIWKAIGDGLLPILTEFANLMADAAPAAVAVTRVAIAALVNAFYMIEDAAVAIVEPVKAAFATITSAAVNAASAIKSVLSMDFSGAANSIKQIGNDAEAAAKRSGKAITDQLTKHKNAIKEILNPDQTAHVAKGGTRSAPNLEKKGGGKGKNEELAYQEELINHQKTMDLQALENKKIIAQSELNLGKITKEKFLEMEQDFENQKYEIERSALVRRQELIERDPNSSPAAKQKALDQILELQAKHESAILKLKLQTYEESQKYNQQAAKSIEDSFQTLFSSVISGQKSLSEAFNDFINSIVSALSKLAAQNIAKFLFGGDSGGGGSALGGVIGSIFGGSSGSGSSSGGGGLLSGIGSAIGAFFGGARAGGGSVDSGMAYMVGEKGPEMFVPRTSGSIVPSGQSGGAVMVNNYFTINGQMTQQSQQQIAAAASQSLTRASRRNN